MANNKKILITGGAGFIGSALAKRLYDLGNQVTIIDNLSTGSRKNLKDMPKVKFIKSDLIRIVGNKDFNLGRFDTVFHLAANPYIPPSIENPAYDYKNNLETSFLLLEKLRLTKKPPLLINASSAAVYGSPKIMPIQEDHLLDPVSPYGVSKLAVERYAAIYSQLYNLKVINLRFFSVFGPGQKKQVIFDLLEKIKKYSKSLEVYGDGSQKRDFIFIDDLISAIILIVARGKSRGEAYNIASGQSYTIKQVVRIICKVCKAQPKIIYSGKNRLGDAEKWEVNISKIRNLGFRPKIDLQTGIKKVQEWIEEEDIDKGIYD